VTKDEYILYLEAQNAALKHLEVQNAALKHLEVQNIALKQRVKILEEKIETLLNILQGKVVKKDSHNSNNPPSHDKFKPKKNRSLRKKTGKKTGGQIGHKGQTLKQKDTPDKYIDLKSEYCNKCGSNLSEKNHYLLSKRQVVEIPPIKPIYIEYRQHVCKCLCGHEQKADYPKNVNAPIQYGRSVIALICYLNVFQYVPYARLKEMFTSVFGLPLSEGSIENLLNKGARKSISVYNAILEHIKSANYVGSDETGAKVNGKKWWIWVWQNIENTFITASNNRGFATVERIFPDGLKNATIGSDRWAAQLKIGSKNKQLCFPHLQRDLIFIEETEKDLWASHFKNLLKKILELRKVAVERNVAYQKDGREVFKLEQQLNRLLTRCINKQKFPKTFAFQKSMIKNRNYLFSCIYDLEVPPDNNASERAIRNIKVKQKISGQFKSGQDTFCILRSVIDTFKKRNLNILEYLGKVMAI